MFTSANRTGSVSAPDQPLLDVRNVSKRFRMHSERQRSFQEIFVNLFRRSRYSSSKEFWALRDVSFQVMSGESLGVIGANGSGKSTLLKLLAGILEPTTGEIVVNGRISALLELGAGFHPDLTGRENIFLNGTLYGLSRQEMQKQMESIIEFSELNEFIDVPIKHYSSGMYVRLGFSVAIHTDPDLLLVDEVLAVGDANFQHKCMDAIQKYRQRGGSILLVSHDLGAIESICDRAIWYEHGQVQALGHPTDVVMQYLNNVATKEEAVRSAAGKGRSVDQLADGQRWGTGRVQITDVKLCDGDGVERSIFVTGAAMQIHLRYRADQRIQDPIFGIALHHHNGTWVAGPNTDFGDLSIPSIEGEGEVIYRIPSLSLLAGGYSISAAAVNRSDTEMYDYHDRAYQFRVHTGNMRERYGVVTLGGHWTTDQKPAPRQNPRSVRAVPVEKAVQV